jgi:hypothetical protein
MPGKKVMKPEETKKEENKKKKKTDTDNEQTFVSNIAPIAPVEDSQNKDE